MNVTPELSIVRGTIVDFIGDPTKDSNACRVVIDGAFVIENGIIIDRGDSAVMQTAYPNAICHDYSGQIIMPGFIDAHIHFPQQEIVGSYGKQLLDWLDNYTFPAEEAFGEGDHAEVMAKKFIDELFRNGTTCCMAYATVQKSVTEALFAEASKRDMCLFAGKVLMNRNAPEGLLDTVEQAEAACRALIERWHGVGRNHYVLTPRFAISCTAEEMQMAAALHREHPTTYIQTHLSENKAEWDFTHTLFPECDDYLAVYEKMGLLTDRTVFAHAIHLSESEWERLSKANAVIAHCPTSNLFLGSGLFNMEAAYKHNIALGIATDIGAGTSFSLLKTLGEAYKVQQLRGYSMNAFESFYKITLGAAKALKVDSQIGSIDINKVADFVVIDPIRTDLEQLRTQYMQRTDQYTPENLLFGLQTLGDDRNIVATYVKGKKVYER